jgi:WD40 repeat protein
MYDVQTGQATQIAKHDAPIRVIKYVDTPSGGIVVTGSWDKTVKVRDTSVTQLRWTLTWLLSTGTSVVRTPYLLSLSPNVVIVSTYPTH